MSENFLNRKDIVKTVLYRFLRISIGFARTER